MTLFEYLAVSVSIVLSFGVIRLLDGLQFALRRDSGYWVHSVWVFCILWTHALFWWNFWSYNSADAWTYARFLATLVPPAMLYSLAIAAIPRDPGEVESWREHFSRSKVRIFRLYAGFFASVMLLTWLMLDQPFLHPLRAVQATGIAIFVGASLIRRESVQGALAIFMLIMLAVSVFVFSQPAPLTVIGAGP
jgi:hypothetical protein